MVKKKIVKKRGRKKTGSGKRIDKAVSKQKQFFYILLIITVTLLLLNVVKMKGLLIPSQYIDLNGKETIDLDDLTLEQKVAQMVIVAGLRENYVPWRNLQVGGIHLFALSTEHVYNNTIIDFQHEMDVPFFVTADLEGCVSPFIHIKNFTYASEIDNIGDAYEKGFRDGEYLDYLGFNLNFAPVVDLDDQIWKCRAFQGDAKNIAELAQAYTLGIQDQGIIATVKHYPGKTLVVKDPHKFVTAAKIGADDVYPYEYMLERGDVKAVMVSHLITTGEVDTDGLPSVVSKEVIDKIKQDYEGLIISDEIHMLGLKNFYGSLDEMYIAVYKAGNDIILNFDRDPYEVQRMVRVVAKAVRSGKISEKQIDNSVRKILEAKGFTVKD